MTAAPDPHSNLLSHEGGSATADRTDMAIWDLPVRVCHWLLVVLFTLSYLSGEFGGFAAHVEIEALGLEAHLDNMTLHMVFGTCILALVLFRVVWGVVGSTTAQFRHFIRGPAGIRAYLAGIMRPERPVAGHNPLGGLMVTAFLIVLLVHIGLGLASNDDILFEGPLADLVGKRLSDTLTGLHGITSKVLLGMVVLHIAAVGFHHVVKRENLTSRMITGRMRWPYGGPVPRFEFRSLWLAAGVFAASAAVAVAVVALP